MIGLPKSGMAGYDPKAAVASVCFEED